MTGPETKKEYAVPERVAILTGAARGIGRAAALRLAQEGYAVVLSGRDADALAPVRDEVCAKGGRGAICVADLLDGATPAKLVETALAEFGQLDVLVNSAGVAKLTPLLELDTTDWQSFFDLHVTATFRCSQAAARVMVAAGKGGAIINVSSIAASMAMYGTGAYASAKGAVSSFTRVLAVELAPHRIAVNAVAPGPVATEQLRKVYSGPMYAERSRSIPLNRLGEPSEVAEAIAFLASPASAYITGQVLTVDGGASAVGCYSYETYKRQGPTS
jgi:NAD(P)-dependent dehydrogenase (short-subunit alcohol dehydrogenase family)